ncbi:DUF4091 domain-containing protein [Paenibacillus sp. MAH-36]|uniref:DUF4091 domain-containing protein n=3 Tax=Paenibacillus TaxID=44249 RepID=A0ABU3R5X5_9BACL|nr:DUF4091 domain-containing protein [Paenibacillus sp. PFR10]MDU0199642.1 DUF4091 domain-containing protein [Paenibacillus sp. PFR10]
MPTLQAQFETRCLSSLVKVFADEELQTAAFHAASALQGEIYSFQVAYRSQALMPFSLTVTSTLSDGICLRSVQLVPAEFPNNPNHDEGVLRDTPGLYPDLLVPVPDSGMLTAIPKQWRSIWVTMEVGRDAQPGSHAVSIAFVDKAGETLASEMFTLTVLPAVLPEQKLLHTEWFHTDSLAVYYGEEVFSERYWEIVESYVQTAATYGCNMLLTPIFTPPLDTEVGGERPTVQLVDVWKNGESYTFGFERLKRWVEMGNRNGVKVFELSHLFTQWGAKHAPKIMGSVDGRTQRIFGWETDAAGEAYLGFLAQFLPELVGFLKENDLLNRTYYHISDEPTFEHLTSYSSASRWVRQFMGDIPSLDALTNLSFYEQGLVQTPVVASNHIEPFLEREVDPLWTYYCCSQYEAVSNRFLCMPSARNRILGLQLYKYNIAGFLHWGYNFWFSQYAKFPIDPYRNTDAHYAFPAGDPFVVYPSQEGTPLVSLRLEVFREALQDLRALELLDSLIGREQTIALMEEGAAEPITFASYPKDEAWLLTCRERINAAIGQAAASGVRTER